MIIDSFIDSNNIKNEIRCMSRMLQGKHIEGCTFLKD